MKTHQLIIFSDFIQLEIYILFHFMLMDPFEVLHTGPLMGEFK